MQENNFEKQVQQKMEELKLVPSKGVWQKVAGTLTKKKSGRRLIAIILLLLVLGSSAIFILFNQPANNFSDNKPAENKARVAKGNSNKNAPGSLKQPVVADNTNNNITNPTSSVTSNGGVNKNEQPVNKTSTRQKTLTVKTNKPLAANAPFGKNIAEEKDVKDFTINKLDKNNFKTSPKQRPHVTAAHPADLDETITFNDSGKMIANAAIPNQDDVLISKRLPDAVSKDIIAVPPVPKDTLSVMTPKDVNIETGVKKMPAAKQKSKWKMGVNFSAGVAATQNGLLASLGLGNTDDNKVFFDAYQSGVGAGVPPSNVYYQPAKIKSGAGFVFGMCLQKNITSKANFLFGLNYKQYNSAMVIGSRVDSVANFTNNTVSSNRFFYRTGNKTNYKNRFHFIELPVAIQLKLGKQSKVPIFVNTGISFSQLLSTNALQFDLLSGSYYSNNDLFNKTQVNISGGLLFGLSRHAANPFLIGPDINFSVTKMAGEGLYKNRHYSYFGLQVKKGIGRK